MLRFLFAFAAVQAFSQNPQTDCRERYRNDLEAKPASSLAHYQVAECFFDQRNFQSAANEFREALSGDLEPAWTIVWSRIKLGHIFDVSGQRDRALNEYKFAGETHDNTRDAQDEVAKYKKEPYKKH